MNIRYIILNGPPRSGKTTIARELTYLLNGQRIAENYGITQQDSFSSPMKHFVATALGEQYQKMDRDKPRPELNGYSVRDFLIYLAEECIKPRFGDDIFGRWLVHRSLRNPVSKPRFYLVDDGGYGANELAIPRRFVVRIERKGYSFDNDSRRYLPDYNYLLENNQGLPELLKQVKVLADVLLKGM
jgi:hypothetical protein